MALSEDPTDPGGKRLRLDPPRPLKLLEDEEEGERDVGAEDSDATDEIEESDCSLPLVEPSSLNKPDPLRTSCCGLLIWGRTGVEVLSRSFFNTT